MTAPHNILLIEDDPNQARLLTHWLNHAGYAVEWERDGRRALERVQASGFDLVLSDIGLPNVNGLKVLAAAKQSHPDVPALLFTAFENGRLASQAVDLGVDGYLIKPLARKALLRRTQSLLARYAKKAESKGTILAIGAHPDDIEIGCGGALLAHAAQGHETVVLTLTEGAQGGDRTLRVQECRRAADRMGATLITADLPDTAIQVDGTTIRLIEEVIRRIQPTVVYTHSKNDMHQDHRSVYDATLVAARSVPELLCYQSPSSTIDFRPNRFVDVGGHLDAKLELLECFATQTRRRPYLEPEFIRATARYWGRYGGWTQCEAFEVIRAR